MGPLNIPGPFQALPRPPGACNTKDPQDGPVLFGAMRGSDGPIRPPTTATYHLNASIRQKMFGNTNLNMRDQTSFHCVTGFHSYSACMFQLMALIAVTQLTLHDQAPPNMGMAAKHTLSPRQRTQSFTNILYVQRDCFPQCSDFLANNLFVCPSVFWMWNEAAKQVA